MAIFSRKQSAKRTDDPAKVNAESSPEERATVTEAKAAGVDEPPTKEAQPERTSSSETTAKEATPDSSGAADAKAAEAVVAAEVEHEASHEVVEPEPMTPPVQTVERHFGIDDAIQLMRSLPSDPNMSLVVRVVRVTLGAVHVSIDEIIADALRKEARIKENIAALEGQIADLEKQLGALRRDIASQQSDLKETANVRERLHMADQYPGPKSLPPPISNPAIPRLTPSKPIPTQS